MPCTVHERWSLRSCNAPGKNHVNLACSALALQHWSEHKSSPAARLSRTALSLWTRPRHAASVRARCEAAAQAPASAACVRSTRGMRLHSAHRATCVSSTAHGAITLDRLRWNGIGESQQQPNGGALREQVEALRTLTGLLAQRGQRRGHRRPS